MVFERTDGLRLSSSGSPDAGFHNERFRERILPSNVNVLAEYACFANVPPSKDTISVSKRRHGEITCSLWFGADKDFATTLR